jgi:hypothetical protein
VKVSDTFLLSCKLLCIERTLLLLPSTYTWTDMCRARLKREEHREATARAELRRDGTREHHKTDFGTSHSHHLLCSKQSFACSPAWRSTVADYAQGRARCISISPIPSRCSDHVFSRSTSCVTRLIGDILAPMTSVNRVHGRAHINTALPCSTSPVPVTVEVVVF